MATHNLAITAVDQDSAALQVRVNIQYEAEGPISVWETTPYTLTVEENTEVTVIAPGVHHTLDENVPTCYKFKEWTGDGAEGDFPKIREVTMSADFAIVLHMELQTVFPTQSPTRRISKFDAKTDEEVAASRILALKPMMVEQAKDAYISQVDMENKVGRYVNDQGLYAHQLHHYRNFGQALWRLTRMYTGATLTAEAQALADMWAAKDLDPAHLTAIAKLFGITVTLA